MVKLYQLVFPHFPSHVSQHILPEMPKAIKPVSLVSGIVTEPSKQVASASGLGITDSA